MTRAGSACSHGVVSEVRPGIVGICVGGHSAGQLVLVVNGGDGRPVVLASDAVHYYEELEHERPFAIYFDLDGMVAGYETVRRLAEENGAEVVAGHDPLVLERFPPLPDGLAELGARARLTAPGAVDCMTIIRVPSPNGRDMNAVDRVGIVGLGNMGGRIAGRILAAGHELVGHDRDPLRAEIVGVKPAASLAALVADTDDRAALAPRQPGRRVGRARARTASSSTAGRVRSSSI